MRFVCLLPRPARGAAAGGIQWGRPRAEDEVHADIFRSRCFAQGGVQVDVSRGSGHGRSGVDADFDGAGRRGREEGRQQAESCDSQQKAIPLSGLPPGTSLPYARTLLHPGAGRTRPVRPVPARWAGKIEKNRSILAKDHSGGLTCCKKQGSRSVSRVSCYPVAATAGPRLRATTRQRPDRVLWFYYPARAGLAEMRREGVALQ